MIPYSHFALENLFLENGFERQETAYGEATSYVDEDGLEECIRRILLRTPVRLNGRQLRFLRRGLGLSQEAFGQLIEKDGQTVARLEKSHEDVPKMIDLVIRARYFAQIEPSKSIGEILSIHDCTAKIPTERIILSNSGNRWTYRFDIPKFRIEFVESQVASNAVFVEDITDGGFIRQRRLKLSTTMDETPQETAVRTEDGWSIRAPSLTKYMSSNVRELLPSTSTLTKCITYDLAN